MKYTVSQRFKQGCWSYVVKKNTNIQYVQPWHTHSFPTLPLSSQVDPPNTPPPPPQVARQHVLCVDTHLPSGFSALNLVLIANWVGEHADADWMRNRQPRLWLRPRRRLSHHEVTETVRRDTTGFRCAQRHTCKLMLGCKCKNINQSLGSRR